jgi:hypothetical protein
MAKLFARVVVIDAEVCGEAVLVEATPTTPIGPN